MKIVQPSALRARPTVSVVVPCYNYGHYLPQALESILSQEGVDLEVIIVDDCSTDGSDLVAARLAEEHRSVRLIRNEVNKRHIATYNIGLAETSGKYVVLLSADDMLAEGSLARATALMEAHPNVGMVYGYSPSFSDTPPPMKPAHTWSLWEGSEWIRTVTRRGDNVVVNPEVVMRNSVMKRLVGYDAEFPHAADLLLWLQSATLADIGRVNGVQAYYRTHASQMHVTDYAGTLTDMRERMVLYNAFFAGDGRGARLPGAKQMLRNAARATAREAVWCALLAELANEAVGGADARAFSDFARATYPTITRSLPWRELHRRRREERLLPDGVISFAYHVKWMIKWRIWRLAGI